MIKWGLFFQYILNWAFVFLTFVSTLFLKALHFLSLVKQQDLHHLNHSKIPKRHDVISPESV